MYFTSKKHLTLTTKKAQIVCLYVPFLSGLAVFVKMNTIVSSDKRVLLNLTDPLSQYHQSLIWPEGFFDQEIWSVNIAFL
jgi:hypothetical protein